MNTRPDPFLLRPQNAGPLILRKPVRGRSRAPLGQILVDIGALSSADMLRAIAMRAREDVRLGDILLANRMVTQTDLFRGLAFQYNCDLVDLEETPPDARLIDLVDPADCLKKGYVPLRKVGAATIVVTSRPENFAELKAGLPASLGTVLMAVAPESDIQQSITRMRRRSLARRAETRVDALDSCRGWSTPSAGRFAAAALIGILAFCIAAPLATFLFLSLWAIAALVLNTGMKLMAVIAVFRKPNAKQVPFVSSRKSTEAMRLPTISLLVPLFREKEIAGRLIRRLGRLTYPRELLDVCLIVEEDDTATKTALAAAALPAWMRQIDVPRGALKTKPRALNYALDFCRGSIVGVYDAEDAPEPDQLFKVARKFHLSDPRVACLQGVLDFYNPRENWLSRCFTVEYATWFRVVLPGLQKLGFVIPLGGTTLFFRKAALEEIGGWDAHNVTEDADLGIRLARRGYCTELLATVTREEANCHFWPWVKQRSRWLKGYAITWAVHMKSPRRLLNEIGLRRFLGVQLLFVGTLSQFLLAPLLWTFWALPLGLPHPVAAAFGPTMMIALTGVFLTSEAISLVVGVLALSEKHLRGLRWWVPTLHLYFPLGALAAYKGLWELIVRPFYWDKTEHGAPRDVSTRFRRLRHLWRRISRAGFRRPV